MKRYAIYFAPRPGAFADRGAAWLGWDAATGAPLPQPDLPGLSVPLADATAEPRRYGFHGTLRAPFRPADGVSAAAITRALATLAAQLAPARCDGLQIRQVDGFWALTPVGAARALCELAAAVVDGSDRLRAPLTEAEIARRRPERLTPRQRALLDRWGYPFVMEEFRFHLTLTGRLPDAPAPDMAQALQAQFGPVLPRPFVIEDLCLFGEDEAGRFHLLQRHPLTG